MFKIIKKADIALFVLLILIGLGLSWWSLASGTQGQKVVVTVDGKLYGTYSLVENQTVEIRQRGRLNKITIKDETVQMSYSDCRNQVCVRTNQSIVCLPNKVMVEITGGEEDFDAISN